ncbi:hypothetical protein ABZX66_20950 [Micromonospora aurantiaca]|uniref:hypothetical protein n=1 Tax=Micromonospora aurantiaca (nom. illeg.) TaxID=47850 RepID=UPI0033B96DC4
MLDTYQGTGCARIFVGVGKPVPTWDGPVLGPLVAAGVPVVHLSVKDRDWTAVKRLVDGKPAGMLLLLTFGHEPEQGPSEGDLPIEQWKQAWADLVGLLADHPARAELWLVPVYTRYWWEKNRGDLRWLLDLPVDAIGWDIYNNGSGYRTPDDLLTIPREIAEKTGLPYLVGELGALPQPSDTDGSGRDAWMRAMVDAIRADGALTCCWFHKDGWDLMATGSEPAQKTWQTLLREETPVATTAPDNLLAVRNLLLTYLNVDKKAVRADDLEPAEVGIVGNAAHLGGYHCGADRVVSRDYSVIESSRDRTGLSKYASALDVGTFSVRAGGKTHNLRTFSAWVVAQCKAGAADTRDIREVIYSPDGKTVKRWDRLGKRTTGDSSHLYHTHFSFFRDATKAGRDQTPLFRRYLTAIGLIKPPAPTPVPVPTPVEDPDMEQSEKLARTTDSASRTVGHVLADMANLRNWLISPVGAQDAHLKPADGSPLAVLLDAAGRDDTDEQAIADRVIAALDPATLAARIAEHLPADQARRVADELSARLAA